MDASTTALAVARHLKARGGWSPADGHHERPAHRLGARRPPGITVADARRPRPLGGPVGRRPARRRPVQRINVQKAFVGAAGFTHRAGLSDATDEEAQIKRAMVAAAREVIAIVDHTKWERAAFATFCPTDEIDAVLTDDAAPGGDGRGAASARRSTSASVRAQRRAPRRRQPDARRTEAAVTPSPEAGRRAGPARRAARHLEAVRRDPGARRRLARPARRARSTPSSARTAPARARSSRSSAGVHQPDSRHDPCSTASRVHPGPAHARALGHRRRPPGAAAVPRPDRRRERLHRPRPVRARSADRLGRDASRGARRCFAELDVQFDVGAPVRGLSMADQQLIEIAKALSVDARVLILDEPTASLSRARGRAAVHDRPPACATAASPSCSSATASTRSSSCATGRPSSATAGTSSRRRRAT